jgi:hypothetical protein
MVSSYIGEIMKNPENPELVVVPIDDDSVELIGLPQDENGGDAFDVDIKPLTPATLPNQYESEIEKMVRTKSDLGAAALATVACGPLALPPKTPQKPSYTPREFSTIERITFESPEL